MKQKVTDIIEIVWAVACLIMLGWIAVKGAVWIFTPPFDLIKVLVGIGAGALAAVVALWIAVVTSFRGW